MSKSPEHNTNNGTDEVLILKSRDNKRLSKRITTDKNKNIIIEGYQKAFYFIGQKVCVQNIYAVEDRTPRL